jgi:hypothetical protein
LQGKAQACAWAFKPKPACLGLILFFKKKKNTNDVSSASLDFDHHSGVRKIRAMPLLVKKKNLDF